MDNGSTLSESLAALETVIIFSSRYIELGEFYRRGLNLDEPHHSPGHVGFQIGPVYLGFDESESEPEGSAVSVWFTVNDLQASFDRLIELGGKVRYAPTHKPWGGFLASVFDPDGNVMGLSQRRLEHDDGN